MFVSTVILSLSRFVAAIILFFIFHQSSRRRFARRDSIAQAANAASRSRPRTKLLPRPA